MKLILDDQDLARWPRGRQPVRADFKPEVQAVMDVVGKTPVFFVMENALGFEVQIAPKVKAKVKRRKG